MTTVTIGFPYRVPQDLSGYPSGPGGIIPFAFEIEGTVSTRANALVAASFFREEFFKQMKDLGISSRMQVLIPEDGSRAPWIPTCYLDEARHVKVNGIEVS
ncbi:MAG: hypothetical protein WAZ27_01550 [Minisyncoccia bacterium]